MDKLSSILPSSPRIQNVDMEGSHPVRPGVASYGRPVGRNPIKDRFTLSQQAKDIAFKETLAGMNPKESKSTKIVNEMYKNFFENKVSDGVKAKPASEETFERNADIDQSIPVDLDVEIAVPSPGEAKAPAQNPTPRLDVEA
jgi:hypothetical protein